VRRGPWFGHGIGTTIVVTIASRGRRLPMTLEQILADYARDELLARLTGLWL
jgi:hypothetical protein